MKLNPNLLAKSNNIENNEIIYLETNEDLVEILEHFDVKDKDVLTVLASSDQLLSFYYYQAKNIDTFDRSYSTLYYYYLRKWLILYKNIVSIINFNLKEINSLIDEVKPSNKIEKEAKTFWKKYFKTTNYNLGPLFEWFSTEGTVPYTNNIDSIKKIFDTNLNFTHMDITEPTSINKKYDIIYLSNMMEYIEVAEHRNTVRKNLENLLNDDGIAILTYKMHTKGDVWNQREIYELTKNSLVYDSNYSYYKPFEGKKDLAYTYRKIKKR